MFFDWQELTYREQGSRLYLRKGTASSLCEQLQWVPLCYSEALIDVSNISNFLVEKI